MLFQQGLLFILKVSSGSFLKALLMDWPDIPSKWSTLSVNSLSDKDPLLFTFPFYKSSARFEVHKEGQMSTKFSLCVGADGKMDRGEKESIGSPFMCWCGEMIRVYCGGWLELFDTLPLAPHPCVHRPALCLVRREVEPF